MERRRRAGFGVQVALMSELLNFEPGGLATRTARLALAGFSEPVDVNWELEG